MIDSNYIQELKAQKHSEGSVKNEFWVLNTLDQFKPLEHINKNDLMRFFENLNKPDNSLLLFQSIVKKYFKAIGKPDISDWIKKKRPRETLRSEDILTTDDINKMIEATDNHYWKAMIAFLYETGCRISEAMSLKFKDFQDTDQGMIVNILTTKTAAGYRKLILPFSSQYIRNLKLYAESSGTDIVFKLQLCQTNKILRRIAKKAGIDKPISCHKFRHGQATDLVRRGYNEAIIRKKLGWSATSLMIARYQHLNDEDVINATLDNTGKLPITAAPRTEIKEAERISLVDAAMQFSKLSEENENLKMRMSQRDARLDALENAFSILQKNSITLSEFERQLKEEGQPPGLVCTGTVIRKNPDGTTLIILKDV